eukprot:gene16244-17883_t
MRRHSLIIENDSRTNFALSTFGFLNGGGLMVDIQEFSFKELKQSTIIKDTPTIGFSLEKTGSDGVSSYMEQHTDKCVLREKDGLTSQVEMVLFTLDFQKMKIRGECVGSSFKQLKVTNLRLKDRAWYTDSLALYVKQMLEKLNVVKVESEDEKKQKNHTIKRSIGEKSKAVTANVDTTRFELPLNKSGNLFTGTITVLIDIANEGLYNLYFHNCQSKQPISINMKLRIIEHNVNTFLSAGEIPLPTIYGLISAIFFMAGCFYLMYLRRHREWTFKIHYLMAAVVLLKSFSLAFHGINYFYIGKDGRRMESWAVLFYITHLLKGALMFTCIVLIGTGFFFVKQVLSTKEKRIFMIVIPLQILANIASIMIDSTEEGKAQYKTWISFHYSLYLPNNKRSIKHLQEAAKTDGKAAISLAKLKLFRHFYVMIVCYIYFTRIIVYLIKLFTELAALLFFIMTGYKFRPAPTNPYLHVPDEDIVDDIELNEIQTRSGLTDGLARVNVPTKRETSHASWDPSSCFFILLRNENCVDNSTARREKMVLRPDYTIKTFWRANLNLQDLSSGWHKNVKKSQDDDQGKRSKAAKVMAKIFVP